MQRRAVSLVCVAIVGGCAVPQTDDRPRTLEYITKAVLQPSCGTTQCHSTFVQRSDFIFDTVAGARRTFQLDTALLSPESKVTFVYAGEELKRSKFVAILYAAFPDSPRMPYDAPLPNLDIQLISDWVEQGGPGVCVGESSCFGTDRVACTDEGGYDFDQVLEEGGCQL